MDERRKFMETGEMGFCPVCGTISDVVVMPDDRLQKRIAKLMEKVCQAGQLKNETPDIIVRVCFARIRETLETPYGRDVKEMLVAMQALLMLAAEAQGELLGEEIDLVRLTVEALEAIRG
jgi:hypothetical protein